ncbi:MAG: hypothetical protein AAFN50_15565 [Pseudomonadota bacterium]
MPRLGMSGHGIRDVYILILQGNRFAALDALEEAVDEGFANSMSFNGWTMVDDPILDAIRDEPRFAEIERKLNERINTMRESYETARDANDWQPLLAKAGST